MHKRYCKSQSLVGVSTFTEITQKSGGKIIFAKDAVHQMYNINEKQCVLLATVPIYNNLYIIKSYMHQIIHILSPALPQKRTECW